MERKLIKQDFLPSKESLLLQTVAGYCDRDIAFYSESGIFIANSVI